MNNDHADICRNFGDRGSFTLRASGTIHKPGNGIAHLSQSLSAINATFLTFGSDPVDSDDDVGTPRREAWLPTWGEDGPQSGFMGTEPVPKDLPDTEHLPEDWISFEELENPQLNDIHVGRSGSEILRLMYLYPKICQILGKIRATILPPQ